MSLCGAADGRLLVHRGSSPGCHGNASRLPFPHFGNSSIQESVHSVFSGDKFPLPQWSFDGVVHRGVGPASQDSPEGPQYCWLAAGQVSVCSPPDASQPKAALRCVCDCCQGRSLDDDWTFYYLQHNPHTHWLERTACAGLSLTGAKTISNQNCTPCTIMIQNTKYKTSHPTCK